MAVMDDEFLGTVLHAAGEAFPVPPSGADDILRRARNAEDGDTGPGQASFALGDVEVPRSRSLRATVGSHRLLSAAAAVVVVVAVGGTAVLLGSSNRARGPLTAAPVTSTTFGARKATAPLLGTSGATASGAAIPTAPVVTPQAGASTPASGGTTGATPATTPPLANGTVGQPARIQQTGSLDLEVAKGSLQSTITKLTFLAGAYNGFVANSQTQLGSGAGGATGSVTLQVPVASFSAVLKSAQSMGRTLQLTTKATDVTAQYVDLQAQITAAEASRQQYLTIMARATSIGDVLAVQSQLDSLQSQIQQLQGQLNVLGSETSYSTLNVLLSESATVHHHRPPPPESGVAKAWHDSVHGFVDGVEGLIRVAGPLLFILLCAGALLVAGRLLWRRYQRHAL